MAGLVGSRPGPVIPARALGPGSGADAVPAARGQGGGDVVSAQPAFAAGEGRYPVVAGHRQGVAS
jgi:hypothetical protein